MEATDLPLWITAAASAALALFALAQWRETSERLKAERVAGREQFGYAQYRLRIQIESWIGTKYEDVDPALEAWLGRADWSQHSPAAEHWVGEMVRHSAHLTPGEAEHMTEAVHSFHTAAMNLNEVQRTSRIPADYPPAARTLVHDAASALWSCRQELGGPTAIISGGLARR